MTVSTSVQPLSLHSPQSAGRLSPEGVRKLLPRPFRGARSSAQLGSSPNLHPGGFNTVPVTPGCVQELVEKGDTCQCESPGVRMLTQHRRRQSSTTLPVQGSRNWHSHPSAVLLNFAAVKVGEALIKLLLFKLCHRSARNVKPTGSHSGKTNPLSSPRISGFTRN